MAQTPQDVLAMISDQGIRVVDFRFTDFPGHWQHFTVLASEVEEETFEDGLALTDPVFAAGRPSTNRTCSSCPMPPRRLSILSTKNPPS